MTEVIESYEGMIQNINGNEITSILTDGDLWIVIETGREPFDDKNIPIKVGETFKFNTFKFSQTVFVEFDENLNPKLSCSDWTKIKALINREETNTEEPEYSS